ncbi:hypothetical protein EXIGLDRAFT_296705 [Exidia glandulosa HHB12029]|uniref:Uncharacterized protein n=1 Tax=Exidia glandulosa HHB12029 TaxID=1314781 RepID=A0A165DC53_EXIGL|nr:hypothetical protein EXIGLDRAFT_296705 [Exidia glandulosa HHB12029]
MDRSQSRYSTVHHLACLFSCFKRRISYHDYGDHRARLNPLPQQGSTLDCAQSCSICASWATWEGKKGRRARGGGRRDAASGREVDPASWLRSSSISTTCATRNWGPSLNQPPRRRGTIGRRRKTTATRRGPQTQDTSEIRGRDDLEGAPRPLSMAFRHHSRYNVETMRLPHDCLLHYHIVAARKHELYESGQAGQYCNS